MTQQLTQEQIQQFLAQMQANGATPAAATPAQAAPAGALPGMGGFDDAEVMGDKPPHMYLNLGRFEGVVKSIEFGETSEESRKGRRPKFVITVEVTSSTNDKVPVGCTVAYVQTGGDKEQTGYMHQGIKKSLGALLGRPAGDIKSPDVAVAVGETQPYTGRPIGWEVMEYTSKKSGNTSSVVSFFHVAS